MEFGIHDIYTADTHVYDFKYFNLYIIKHSMSDFRDVISNNNGSNDLFPCNLKSNKLTQTTVVCYDDIFWLCYSLCYLCFSGKWNFFVVSIIKVGYVCLDFNLILRYFQLNGDAWHRRVWVKNKSSCTPRIVLKTMASPNSWRSLLVWPIIFCILRIGLMILSRVFNSTSYLKNRFHSVLFA